MTRTFSNKKRKSKKRILLFSSCVLLAAAGLFLYEIPPFLLDISRTIQSAVGKIPQHFSCREPTPSPLRGTIYDQHLRELAVSYRLYTLTVHPPDVADCRKAAMALAPILGKDAAGLEAILKNAKQSEMLAEGLAEHQAAAIEMLHFPGLICAPDEYRFYPAHTIAAQVLGFMGDNTGLAGLESRYNALLSGHALRDASLSDIDFQGRENLGTLAADLILTLDLRVQRHLERRLTEYLDAHGMERGMALLLEPGSGRILALLNLPSFNPNYFWQAGEGTRKNRVYSNLLDKDLIRPILARAAAIEQAGIDGAQLLPPTVAAPDYGFSGAELNEFEQRIRLYDSVSGAWLVEDNAAPEGAVNGVQIGATLASLVNGGWRITPYLVDSIYDHATEHRYYRKREGEGRTHVLDPALGVKIRRNLFSTWVSETDGKILYKAEKAWGGPYQGDAQNLVTQQLFAGFTPAQYPHYLLMLAVEETRLQPRKAEKNTGGGGDLERLGRELLSYVENNPPQAAAMENPPPPSEENLRQFFISRRLVEKKNPAEMTTEKATMPAVKGLSLRKALQKISPYKMRVMVNGSGVVVAQEPKAGSPLLELGECTLTLSEP